MAERKKFVKVKIPMLNEEIQVLGTPKDLDKKTIKINLSKKLKGKGLVVTFQIANEEDKLVAYPRRFELIKSYLKRIIRKNIDIVEDSFKAKTADTEITIKPFLITRKRVSRAIRQNLRKNARDYLLNYAKEKTYKEICNDVFEGTVQQDIFPKLKKIYPLSFCDFRVLNIEEKNIGELMKGEEPKEDAGKE
jgi:ribosomal protein S3AE